MQELFSRVIKGAFTIYLNDTEQNFERLFV